MSEQQPRSPERRVPPGTDTSRPLPRGVHTLPFRTEGGREVAVAIDGRGHCVDWIMFEPQHRTAAREHLWTSLESHEACAETPLRLD